MSDPADFLGLLNPSQRRAVEHFCGPLLVVAGAGSGKTRALTYRVANLILTHRVAPENILAVTFTNKAAREMKERIEEIFAERTAQSKHNKPLAVLPADEQTRLRSRVWKQYIKPLWIGTFHSLCARILRFDIEKYRDRKGRRWTKNFSIFDENDAQQLVKEIVIGKLNLDNKKFEPRKIRYAISNAKNKGWSPQQLAIEESNYWGRTVAEVYSFYQDGLAANNALDFDDLIRIPVELFQQEGNEKVLEYWHKQFRHVLVDEYQDTNRTQYDFIRLLVTNGAAANSFDEWEHRSVFVVGDVDQSIYSFRMADFTILLEFQENFGDGLPEEETTTTIKLEENYRSTETILNVANHLIENNTERIKKVLRPTRTIGDNIYCYRADSDVEEANFVVEQIRRMVGENPELSWKDFAILYRINALSRPFEDALIGTDILYQVIGGLRFYDRKEVKDAIAYLRVLANPADSVSLKRIINTPRRGIGKNTITNLDNAAQQLGIPLWEIVSDATSVNTLAGRSAKAVNRFANIISTWQEKVQTTTADEIFKGIMDDSGYIADLQQQGTEEADNRRANVEEVLNAIVQYGEENEDPSLETFLANASLASDLDSLDSGDDSVSLMTLHSAKGLEFPIVFMVGLENGLFPNYRSLDDPRALEEERRLCYVGITRAQELLFISYATERRLWGSYSTTQPSMFLSELPKEYLEGNMVRKRKAKKQKKAAKSNNSVQWKAGDRVYHDAFGEGKVMMVFGDENKSTIAVKFGVGSPKILDPTIEPLERNE